MTDHHQFEAMCAIAASGRLTPDEEHLLRQHMANCASCKSFMMEMAAIGSRIFSASARDTYCAAVPSGMQARFIDRVRHEGIPLQSKTTRDGRYFLPHLLSGAAAAILAIFLAVYPFSNPESQRSMMPKRLAVVPSAATASPRMTMVSTKKSAPLRRISRSRIALHAKDLSAMPIFSLSPAQRQRLVQAAFLTTFEAAEEPSGSRRFRYDPSVNRPLQQISYLGSNINWYAAWLDSGP